MNSEIVGRPTNVAWGFLFPNNDDDKTRYDLANIPIPVRHPTQLYEALYYLILFGLFYWLWKNKRENYGRGFMFGLFCILMFGFRFCIEFLKENQVSFENAQIINQGQILSIPFVIIGICTIAYSFKARKSVL